MIRIKDYIFNENNIIQMCINENNNLEIDVNNGFPRVIKNANFSDIEWNYEDEQIRKCLDSIDREEELEDRIDKTIEYIEENKQLFMFDNLRKDGTLQYTIECDADDLLKILKGEENE